MRQRLQFCKDHVDWKADQQWANWAFTDEMAMKIGYKYGVTTVWREGTDLEKWDNTCVGRKQGQGSSVMCWGMIMYNYKGPFLVWQTETEEEKKEATTMIAYLNSVIEKEAEKMNSEWKASPEWAELKERELATARQARKEAKVIFLL